MSHRTLRRAVLGAALAAVCAPVPAHASTTAYGLLSGGTSIATFSTDAPSQASASVAVTGLQAGETLVGIDVRPATGQLYAIGSTSRLYRVAPTTGAATAIGTLTTALSGATFDIDFNPAADRLRIVSDTGQNLRVNPASAATTVDTALNGAVTGATGAAYINSFPGTTTTTLFDIDPASDTLVTQAPPNNGVTTTVGALGVDATGDAAFDIVPGANTALAILNVGATRALYAIDLASGAASARSNAGGVLPYVDLAVASDGVTQMVGLATPATGAQQLFTFRSDAPGTTTSAVTVSGLAAGEKLLSIDARPRTGRLYGLGSTGVLYVLDVETGAATSAGTLGTTLSGSVFDVDFNPQADRLRVVSDAEQNLRVNPDAPAAGGTITDGAFTPGSLDITGAAYTNNRSDTPSTKLFYIDSAADKLLSTATPNAPGTPTDEGQITVGPTGAVVDFAPQGGFDIVGPFDQKYAALKRVGETATRLYTIGGQAGLVLTDTLVANPAAAVPVGDVTPPEGTTVTGLAALASDTVHFGATGVSVGEGGVARVAIVRDSTSGASGPLTVGYATATGTAGEADFTAATGTVTFAPGETVRTVAVATTQDSAVEGNEVFALSLTSVSNGARIGTPAAVGVVVVDDEAPAGPVLVPVPGAGGGGAAAAPFAFVRAATDEIRLSTLRTRGFLARVFCTAACKVSGDLRASGALARRTGTVVAKVATRNVAAGATALIRVKLTSKAAKALRTAKSATLKLKLSATPTAGGKASAPAALTVKAFR